MEKDSAKILLAEDDPNLGTILKAYLEAKGYKTILCTNGLDAYNTYLKGSIDFCLLDVMMPLKDGFTLAKEIRKADKKMPILFLSAKSLQEDILEGLQIGADDYITKPFSMEELLLRIKAIIRRSILSTDLESQTTFYIGKLVFDYNRQMLSLNTENFKLTSKEADLLRLLCLHKNDILDRSEALNKIWYNDTYFNARSMDVYIVKLRKYLKNDPDIELLNIHGKGFRLVVK